MVLDPQVINSLFQGLVLVLGGIGTLLAVRSRRAEVTTREYRRTRTRLHLALAYVYRLGDELAERGIPIPPRPPGLDDDEEDPTPPPRRGGVSDAS
ncbi:MAG: hypothetical protein L0I76_28910 [Pseudonocardia sp.]|nr:hypothetical protein [Pseudonocardia sp.]